MRVGEVLEQEMPAVVAGIPMGFVAARHEPRRLDGRELGVERDLVAAGVPSGAGAVGMPGLEDQRRRRRIGCALVAQAQPDDAREDRVARAVHRDIDDAPAAERAGAA